MGLDILNLQFFKCIFVSIVEILVICLRTAPAMSAAFLQCFEGFKLMCISNFSN